MAVEGPARPTLGPTPMNSPLTPCFLQPTQASLDA
jgi:hypothetical protein